MFSIFTINICKLYIKSHPNIAISLLKIESLTTLHLFLCAHGLQKLSQRPSHSVIFMAISGDSFTINFGRAYATKGLTRPTGNRTAERTDREYGRPTEPTAESAAAACTGPSSISAALWASIVACLAASCQAAGFSLRAAALWATTTGAANCQLATVNNFAYLNIYWWRKRLVALLP